MLTSKDFQRLSEVIQREVRVVVNEAIDSKNLVTRDELLTHVDAIMGEVKAIRENLAASLLRQQEHDYLFENHEARIQKIERHIVKATA